MGGGAVRVNATEHWRRLSSQHVSPQHVTPEATSRVATCRERDSELWVGTEVLIILPLCPSNIWALSVCYFFFFFACPRVPLQFSVKGTHTCLTSCRPQGGQVLTWSASVCRLPIYWRAASCVSGVLSMLADKAFRWNRVSGSEIAPPVSCHLGSLVFLIVFPPYTPKCSRTTTLLLLLLHHTN